MPDGFVGLCYHYIRDDRAKIGFPRILGNSVEAFESHVKMLKSKFTILSPDDFQGHAWKSKKGISVLFTFDDGLKDHLAAAHILAREKIAAFFFLPTCIFLEQEPANPTIIHYVIAQFGVSRFIETFKNVVWQFDAFYGSEYERFAWNLVSDDPWEKIAEIKRIFKYQIRRDIARKILLAIYRRAFNRHSPFEQMHLSATDVVAILNLGHSIGVHSHTHISIGHGELSYSEYETELIRPRNYLEKLFGVRVSALSYPFGGKNDCLKMERLVKRTQDYNLAFTVENVLNTAASLRLELGRYMPSSTDTAESLEKVIHKIAGGVTA